MGCGGEVNYYSLRFSHTCKPSHTLLAHVTKATSNLLVTKSCADPGIFSGGGGGGGGGGHDGQRIFFNFYFVLNLFYSL